jgi:hypothetical protein
MIGTEVRVLLMLAHAATDGVWDNLYVHDLVAYLKEHGAKETADDIAYRIGKTAAGNAADPDFVSPFEVAYAAYR